MLYIYLITRLIINIKDLNKIMTIVITRLIINMKDLNNSEI